MRKIIYDFFSNEVDSNGDYYNIGTFEQFDEDMQDPQARRDFYDFFSNEIDENGDYYNLGTFAEFEQDIARSTAKEIGKASAQATGQATGKAIKEQPKVAHPVTAVQASDRANPFYTKEAYMEWLAQQPKSATKQANQELTSGQVTETPTAPSAPKAEDITTTKATATTAEAPKVETTANPVSALQKADGTPYSAEELQGRASQQQAQPTEQVGEQPAVQVESVDESLVTPTETDQAKLETKATKAEGDQKAESKENAQSIEGYMSQMNALYGNKYAPQRTEDTQTMNLKMPYIEGEINIEVYRNWLDKATEKYVRNVALTNKMKELGVTSLNQAQLIEVENAIKNMSEKEIVEMLGEDGMKVLQGYVKSAKNAEERDGKNTGVIGRLLNNPTYRQYLERFVGEDSVNNEVVRLSNIMRGADIDLEAMPQEQAVRYIGAKALHIDSLFDKSGIDYFINAKSDDKVANGMYQCGMIYDKLFNSNAPNEAIELAKRTIKSIEKNGQLGTEDGVTRLNDVLTRTMEFGSLMQDLTPEDEERILNELRVYFGGRRKITTIEDVAFSDDYGWELLKNNVIELKQAKGMIQSLDDNIDKLNKLERYHREYISQNKNRVERDPYTQMFLRASGADDVQMQMINVAREYYTDADELLNDSGKTGIEGFVAGFSNAIFDEDSWSFGFTDLKKNLIIRNALEKYHRIDSGQSKEQMSDYELALLDAFTTYVAAESLSDPSIAYNVGSGTAISIPYVLQIALTPTGGGRIVAKTLLKYAQKRVKSGLLKGIVKNGAKGVGILTNSATNVLTTGLGNVASKATEVSPKVVNVGENEDGNLAFGGVNEEELSRNKVDAKKVAESIYSQAKTYLIEKTGVWLDKVLVMPKWAKNWFDKKGIEIPRNETWEGVLNRMGYNKVLSEFGEEIMDQMAEVPVSELTLDTNEETGVFSGENIATTALTTMVLSTLLNVPNAMAYKSESARMKADVENLANSGQKAFGKQWDGLQAKIDGATFGEMSQVMSDISNDKNMSSSQKKHALKYAVAKAIEKEFVARYEGEQMARENSAPIKAQAEIEDATIKGLNVKSASESRELQMQEKVAGNSMAETLGVSGITEAEQTLSQRYGTTDASELAISVAQDTDLSEEQKRVIQDYLKVKATNLAKQNKVEKDNRKAMAEARQGIADKTHGDGSIYQAELKNGDTTYIKVGDVLTDKDGKLTTNKDGDNIIVVDENGNKDMISPKDVVSITPIDVDGEIDMAMQAINAEYAKNLAIANGEYAEGDVVTLRTYNGEEQGYSNTNVTIVRESQGADGTIVIECVTEDGSTLILSKDDFYKMADGAIEERIAPTVKKAEVVKPKEQATQAETTQEQSTFKGITPTETEQVVELTAPQQEYYPGKAIVYKDADGVYRMGEVASETDADGNVIIADGITGITQQLPTTQLDQWQQEANAPQAEESQAETPTNKEEQPQGEQSSSQEILDNSNKVAKDVPSVASVTEEIAQEEKPTTTEKQAETTPQVESTATPTAQVAIPTDEKGKKVYEQAPIEATIKDIYNDPELDEEEADAYVQAKIDGATKRIKAIDKKKPKMGEDRDAYVAQRDAWRAERNAEQAKLDYWQGVQAQRTKGKSYETDGVIDESNEPIMSAEESVDGEGGSNVLQGEQLDNNRGNERIARESQGSNVGGIDSNATSQEEIAEAKEAEQYYVDNDNTPGVVGSSYARAVLPSNVAVKLGKIAQALGVSIRIVPTMTDANAKIQGKKVVVAWNAEQIKMFGEDGLWMVVGHELTHRIKALSKEAYEDFASVIESIFPKQFKQRMINTRLAYSRKGMKISDAGLREEVVSDLAGILMTDDKMMAKFLDGLQPKSTKQQILDILKDMLDAIKNIFKGETAMNIAKAERVLLDAMKKANKVVAQDETTEADNATEKLSIIGESGASALDKAEEATQRMDNLAKARKMERFDYPTKSIRMATGWERGADGKWRYEIDDVKLKKTTYENTETTLGELVDNAELFSAYPSLMDLKVVFTDTPNNTLGRTYSQYAEDENGQGAWIPTQISLNNLLVWDDAETESVLAHEIQHAIQSIEGFVNGGDSANKEDYHRLAGEVEARNVQSRIGMTPDQRRATLLAETEDVAREDQIFLMENSGVSAMGSTVVKRKADIAVKLQGKDISPTQLKVVDAFTTDVNNIAIDVVDANGKQRNITLKQGQDNRAGVKHSVLKHYETASNSYSAEDILLIPQIIEQGERKQDGKKVSYKLGLNGVTYSVTTEINNRGAEVFTNFYTNRSGNARSSNTQLSAQADSTTTSADKGSDNIGDVQGLEDYSAEEIKEIAREYIEEVIAENGFDADVVDLAIYGSRRRGDARDDSDLDIVVEYSGNVSEDGLFNALNDAETQLEINGVKVDINPITKGKSGSLSEFMKRAEEYDSDTKYSLRSNSQEVADIVAKAKADGTYMKAPNGEPTNLTEEQWANVRTKAFKDWFGDWELAQKVINIISADKEHGFKNFADARNWAKENIVGLYHNSEIGEVNISRKSIDKYLSGKAVGKSQSIDAHLSTIRVLPQLIENSIVGDIHEDRDSDSNLKDIVRLYGAIDIEGDVNRVKITVKRYADENTYNKAYSYEVMEIEPLEGTLETTHTKSADFVPTSKSSITGANLLKGVENSKGEPILNFSKIVDENGEPMVVYHGTESDFNVFDRTKGRASMDIQGMFFSPWELDAQGYGRNVRAFYLNIRKPSSGGQSYKALNRYQGQMYAGVKARDYLIGLGYDGVDNYGEEFIAFEPNQIKSATDNVGTYSSENDDTRYSLRSQDARKVATDAVITSLEGSGIEVVRVSDAEVEAVLGMANNPEFQIVYHGSGAKFDAFDHNHMGEGEGAQAYGWGTYVTESEGVGKDYAKVANYRSGNGKYLYSVEIPEDINDVYIPYDEVVPEHVIMNVKDAIDDFLATNHFASWYADDMGIDDTYRMFRPGMTGGRLYNLVSKYLVGDKKASEFLNNIGFVGIKYPTNYMSGGNTKGQSNYVIFNDRDIKVVDRVEFLKTPQGEVYGWTDGKKVYLTERGMNPETPIHEYTHIWARVMMQKNAKGWQSVKDLLRDTPMWNEVMNDANYADIRENEDAVASEALSRLSGKENAKRMESEAQRMIDEAKGVFAKAEAVTLVERIRKALKEFWSWVGKSLFGIKEFGSIEEVTDRVLYDLVNNTELGVSEGAIEKQIGKTKVMLSNELDDNGIPFILSSKGNTIFGNIDSESGLDSAPIKLSEGFQGEAGGYGLTHIEFRHGDQIRNKGYESVLDFVEDVAQNYTTIKEGKDRDGNQTYMLQLTDKHNNTLVVELSKNKDYWNVNTAGIFKLSYGRNNKEVYIRHTTDKHPTENAEVSQETEQSGATISPRMNTPTPSADKGKKNLGEKQEEEAKFSLRVGGVLHPQGDDYDGTRKEYNRRVGVQPGMRKLGYKFREGYQDSMLALKELQKIVAKANGKKVEDIPSWQNAYINENLMSSKNKAQHDAYVRDYYKPLINVVKKLIKKGGMKYDDIKQYLIAKHGLERNEKMAIQEAKKVADNAIYKREQDAKNWARIKANQAVEGVDFVDDVARNEAWKQVFDEVYERETFTSEEEKQATWEEVFNKQMKQNRNRDYSGLTAMFGVENVHEAEKMARELVDKVEQPTGKMDELWNAIRMATEETLATQYKAGLLSRDEFEKIRDMYEYYVPLRGFDEKTADEEYEYLVSKKPILQAMNAKAMGRSSLADDPLATIGAMADSAIIQSNRNKMKQAFYHFVKNNPSALVTESEQWYVQDGNGRWVATQPDIPANATSADIEEAIAEHEERMEALKKEGKARTKPNTLDTNFITLPGQAVEHMVKLKINGKEKVLYINGNPRAAQAVNGLTNPEAFNDVIRDFGKVVNNYMAQVFTSKNPAFIFTNGARDLQWAANAVMVKEGWKYQKQYAKNIGKASQVAKYILKYNNGTLKLDDETQRYFNEFISSGGETGYTAINQLDHYKKEIAKMIKGVSKVNPMTAVNGVLDSIEYLNRSVEDITRFAVFMTSRQMGRSLQQSAYDAKEITVNFNKKGSGIMGARYLGAFYIFLNASLQSINNLCRIVKHHPIKATIKFAEIGAVAYALPMLNELLIEAWGDDDDKEAYANLPEWVKKNNVVLYIPDTDGMFFTIPMSHEMRPFATIGYVANKVMNEGYDAKEGMKDIISAFGDMLPIEITGNDGNMAVNLTPTFLQPIAQLVANTDYFGKPIYRDADYTELKPEYTTAFRGTSPILIDASKYINEISGGDAGAKGKADGMITNPDVLEHLIESYFGGLGKLVNKGVKSISAIWDEQLREVRNIPVVSSFVAGSEERTSTGFKQSEEYYALIDEYKKYESKRSSYEEEVLKGARPNATTEEIMNSLEYANKLTELMTSPEAKRYITIKGYKNYVDALNKGLENVNITRRADVEKMLNELKKELISEVDKAENKDVEELTKRNEKFKNDAKNILKDADPRTGLAQDEAYLTNSQMVKDLNEAVRKNNVGAFREWVDKFIKDKHK